MPSALFCVMHKQGNPFTILNNFQKNNSIKTYSLVHLTINSRNLIHILVSQGVSYNYARAYTTVLFNSETY